MAQLITCHVDLRHVFQEVIKHRDCTIIEGRRTQARQDELLRLGQSQLQWPNSKHNVAMPHELSRAVDVGPCFPGQGILWEDRESWLAWGGFVKGVAGVLGVRLRWGGDWDSDWRHNDQHFHDMPHFELLDVLP
jgi:peptidoglycan L-alanyl-D-glutamate endopeptidase CwlK